MTRSRRVKFDLLAQSAHVNSHRAGIHVNVFIPERRKKLLSREDLPGVTREVVEKVELAAGERHASPFDLDGSLLAVDLNALELEAPPAGQRFRTASEYGSDSGSQLARAEGLTDVVVSSKIQPLQPVRLVAASGQHDDRYVAARADSATDGRAIQSGEHEVEDDQISRLLGKLIECRLPVECQAHIVAVAPQIPLNDLRHHRLIFYDEDSAHIASPIIFLVPYESLTRKDVGVPSRRKISVSIADYAGAVTSYALSETTPKLLPPPPSRLWIYTNFDCNLACTYCLTSSSPAAERRALPPGAYFQLIDEAVAAGIDEVFLTGGEPFLLPDIFEKLTYAAERLPTTVLTNGMLLRGRRQESLRSLSHLPITLQVSLDGHLPEIHDAYRGSGSWASTVDVIRLLRTDGFRITIGATETQANAAYTDELRAFVRELGIPEQAFFLRPLTKRGFSHEGIELRAKDVSPELTVTAEGVFWHPQSAGEVMLLSRDIFPLRDSVELMQANLAVIAAGGPVPQQYRCA